MHANVIYVIRIILVAEKALVKLRKQNITHMNKRCARTAGKHFFNFRTYTFGAYFQRSCLFLITDRKVSSSILKPRTDEKRRARKILNASSRETHIRLTHTADYAVF